MDRRDFLKACSTVAVASMIDPSVFSNLLSAQEGMFKAYKKALLVKEDGSPLREEDLKLHNAYIFFYPYASTPCYLIDLWQEGGKVVDGPPEVPLASVVIQEEGGKFYAIGILGVDQFNRFFETYRRELREAYGSTAKARELVDRCVVVEVGKYVKQVIHC